MKKSTKVLSALVVVLGMLLIRSEFGTDDKGVMLSPVQAQNTRSLVRGSSLFLYQINEDGTTLSVFQFDNTRRMKNDFPPFI